MHWNADACTSHVQGVLDKSEPQRTSHVHVHCVLTAPKSIAVQFLAGRKRQKHLYKLYCAKSMRCLQALLDQVQKASWKLGYFVAKHRLKVIIISFTLSIVYSAGVICLLRLPPTNPIDSFTPIGSDSERERAIFEVKKTLNNLILSAFAFRNIFFTQIALPMTPNCTLRVLMCLMISYRTSATSPHWTRTFGRSAQ